MIFRVNETYVIFSISQVRNEETIAIKSACLKMRPDYQPKITVVTVQKRHNTRFFREDMVNHGAKNVVNVISLFKILIIDYVYDLLTDTYAIILGPKYSVWNGCRHGTGQPVFVRLLFGQSSGYPGNAVKYYFSRLMTILIFLISKKPHPMP